MTDSVLLRLIYLFLAQLQCFTLNLFYERHSIPWISFKGKKNRLTITIQSNESIFYNKPTLTGRFFDSNLPNCQSDDYEFMMTASTAAYNFRRK